MQLEAGKVAAVTGAASGIGLALAERFASAGMHVVLADVDETGLAAAAERIGARGVDTLTVRTDVSDEASVLALAAAAVERFGTVHVVCNNAGVVSQADAWFGPLSAWNWVLGVNLWGVIHGVRAFLPVLAAQGEGHIVNTASMAGLLPGFGAAYDATKHAVVALTEDLYLAMQQSGLPIGVSVLCPGWVRTNILDAERNWPGALGAEPPRALGSDIVLGHVKRVIDEGMPPAVVADLVADAVQSDRFWVLPSPEFVELAVQRWHDIAEGVNPRLDVEVPGLPSTMEIAEEILASLTPPSASVTRSWSLAVGRDELTRTELFDETQPDAGAGEAVLRVDRIGMTANNVTYALLGDAMHYWDFFPTRPGWGLVPLWGFGDVVASATEGVEVGSRVYGYFPSASHLVVRPGRVDARGFRDASEHRAVLPSPYNNYVYTTTDAAYEPDQEDLLILFRPLFFTSFMLADQLEDNAFFGASVLAMSSASSKTAYSAAFLLQGKGPEVVGLTSPGNVDFTASLGCYDRVVAYDAVSELDAATPTAYLDLAGSAELRASMRAHLGDQLVHDAVVGVTHQERGAAGAERDARTSFFFAPDQMRKRTGDWGREVVDQRFADAWRGFAPTVRGWVDVVEHNGPAELRDVWLEVLSGKTSPRTGHVVSL